MNKEEIKFNMEQEQINNKIIKINRKIFYKEENELTNLWIKILIINSSFKK